MNPCLNGLEVQEAAEALSPTEKLAKLVGLEDSTAPYVEVLKLRCLVFGELVSDRRLWKTSGLTYRLDDKGFPPWLAQVGANLARH